MPRRHRPPSRRYRAARRDIYLRHDVAGWHVRARRGGSEGNEVTHHFTDEAGARAMVERLKAYVSDGEGNWALMPARRT